MKFLPGKKKKLYASPQVKTIASEKSAILLICTGQYNCVLEVGYDCCQPNADTCFVNC